MFHEGPQPVFRHVGDQVVEQTALAEQGVSAGFDGVGLEMAVQAEAFAGGTEQGEQNDSERIEGAGNQSCVKFIQGASAVLK